MPLPIVIAHDLLATAYGWWLPYAGHPVWAQRGRKVFLDSPDDVQRMVRYIDDNPMKMRMPRQEWSFVTTYDGWPLHPGHDPNSPYARRLRAL